MKPSFALDFRDGVIALHHRTARGWQQVGSTALDAPDLTEALNYLRSTALGLSPRGVSTKLVIPNEQVLYTQVYAPGPDAAKRRRQIKAGIEGLTPYPVEELVFDWWGDGPQVHVAVVARETLAEAEAFAAEHRFNPLSFVAVPDDGAYQGEPFFGPSALSATLLAQGEKVERDPEPIAVVAREFPRSERSEPAAAERAPESQTDVPVADFAVREDPVAPPPVAAAPPAAAPDPVATPAPPVEKVEKLPEAPATPTAALEPNPLPDFRAAVPPPPGTKAFDPKTMAVDLVEEAPMAVDVSDDAPEMLATPPAAAPRPQVITRQGDEIPAAPAAEVIAAFASRRAAAGTTTSVAAPPPAPISSAAPKPTIVSDSGKAPALGSAPAQRPSVPRPSLARPPSAAPVPARGTLPFPAKTAPVAKPAGLAKPAIKPTGAQVTAPGIAGAKRERNVVALPTATPVASDAAPAPVAKPPSRTQTGLDGRPLPSSRRPRYLGLILTGILLVLLALVAAWSSFFMTADDQAPDATPAAASMALIPGADPAANLIPDTGADSAVTEAETATLTAADPTFSEDPQLGDLPTPEEEALADGQDPALVDAEVLDQPSVAEADAAAQTAAEQLAAEQAASAQAAALQAAADSAAAEQAAADQAAADQLATEQAAADQLAAEQAAADKVAADQAAANQAAADKAAAEQVAAEQAAAAKTAADQLAAEQAATEKAAADKLAADQAAADKAAADKLAADRAAADKAAADKLAADQAAAEQLAADQAAAEAAKPDTAIATDPAGASLPGADLQDEIFLAAADTPPATSDPVTLLQPTSTGDPPPGLAPPPPPFGTVYQFDADGRIKPMPDGILTPEGVLLVAGKPKLVPPIRPAAIAAAAAPVVETLPAVTATLPAATTGSTAATAAVEPVISDPALAGKKPKARPATLATDTVKQGDALAPAPNLAPAQDSRFADLRPQPRPPALTVPPALQTTASAASLAADGLQPVAASKLALNVSLNPPSRPDGLNQAVEAAVAAAMKTPAPEPQTQVAAAPEAQPEPEAEAPAPRLPTSASVAKQATDKNAINTGKIALIGVVSAGSSRIALIRQPGGNVKRLKVGDSIDGGRIAAISASSLQYQKGNRMVTLSMPAS